MAFLAPPAWLENSAAHNAQDYRVVLSSLARSGVATAGALAVSQKSGTPNMSVDVAAGGVFVKSTRSAAQGTYHAYSDAVINATLSASDATNPRIDRILVQIRDEAQDAALTQNDARILVVEGTPAASPSAPSITVDDYLELAQVTVPASATSIVDANISDVRVRSTPTNDAAPVVSSVSAVGDANAASYADWPSNTASIAVPSWATRAIVTAAIGHIIVTASMDGDVRVVLGASNGGDWPLGGANGYEGTSTIVEEFDCTSVAGTTVTAKTQAKRVSGTGAARHQRRTIRVDFYA